MKTALTQEERLATDFVNVYATLQGGDEIFTADVLFDVNVPEWRFQIEGFHTFTQWLRNYTQTGYRLDVRRITPTNDGFVVELEGRYEHDGRPTYFRNLIQCRVTGGRISEVVFYCTGDWDPETQRRHAAEVKLVRP